MRVRLRISYTQKGKKLATTNNGGVSFNEEDYTEREKVTKKSRSFNDEIYFYDVHSIFVRIHKEGKKSTEKGR